MKIWQRIWTALLAILMLATFAACAADGNALRAGDDTKFMQGERIRQADLDCLIVRLAEVDEAGKPLEIAPEDVLPVLAVMRAELLEAEGQGTGAFLGRQQAMGRGILCRFAGQQPEG